MTSTPQHSTQKVVAILQGRMTSSRLPGKVLQPVLGQPMIARQWERIAQCQRIDQAILATTTDPEDNPLANWAESSGIIVYRGSRDDVLDRFYQAACTVNPDVIVRLTADCPLLDPDVVDQTISFFLNHDLDYVSNALIPSYPDGLDVEVFRFVCLKAAWQNALRPSQREHVTPYIRLPESGFKLENIPNPLGDFSHLRWTVDEPDDYQLICEIYKALYPSNPRFRQHHILNFLDQHPQWATYNTHHGRNEGYIRSLQQEGSLP